MGDKELSHTCRLELSKNELKTSTQIGLPYQPERMSMNEKKTLKKIPKLRMDPALLKNRGFTPADGYKTTYKDEYKIPVRDEFVMNAKLFMQRRPGIRTRVTRPLTYGVTEYNSQYLDKQLEPCVKGYSVEEMTTCPIELTGRDEREPLPMTRNYGKYLDIYMTTNRLTHRSFTLVEQRGIAAKNIVTVYETMQIPKGRGFGCRFPELSGQDLDTRDPDMIDSIVFKSKTKPRFIPTKLTTVPNFGSESVAQASYKKPQELAVPQAFALISQPPKVVNAISTKQALSPPGMYTTELSAINKHTSPQAVV